MIYNTESKSNKAYGAFAFGMVVVAISACARSFLPIVYGSWGMILGGLAMVIGMMTRAVYQKNKRDLRTRRMDRRAQLGGLCYIVSGGFSLDGDNIWMLIFTIGTIFVVYSVFARKEK